MILVDSHCHLTHPRFAGDLEQVIARARAHGVTRMLTIGTSIADARLALDISRRHPGVVYASAGLDPFACFEAGDAVTSQLAELDRLLDSGAFSALGEIGLEYHHPLGTRPAQREQMELQLALAARRQLPVIIHVREAHEDMLDCLARSPTCHGVIHSFDGGPDEVRAYLDLGWHIAINGMVTFKPKDALREAARLVPADRLMVETDSPYLAPVPMRGQRCEPASVSHTLAALAALRHDSIEALAARTTQTACRLFGWPSG